MIWHGSRWQGLVTVSYLLGAGWELALSNDPGHWLNNLDLGSDGRDFVRFVVGNIIATSFPHVDMVLVNLCQAIQ